MHVIEALTLFPWLHGDPLGELLDLLASKADAEGASRPSRWMYWKGWEFGQKRSPPVGNAAGVAGAGASGEFLTGIGRMDRIGDRLQITDYRLQMADPAMLTRVRASHPAWGTSQLRRHRSCGQ